jgi:hypothetical protein
MDRKELKLLLNYLENNLKHLTPLQNKFIATISEKYRLTGVITKKEVECLSELRDYIIVNSEPVKVFDTESEKYQAQYSSFDYGTLIGGF